MTLVLGRYKPQALKHIFRLAGPGGYAKSNGIIRKKLDALLKRFHRKPAP